MSATSNRFDDLMRNINFDPFENQISKAESYQNEKLQDQMKKNEKYTQQNQSFKNKLRQESFSEASPLRQDIPEKELQEQMLQHEESQDDQNDAIEPMYNRQQVVKSVPRKEIVQKPPAPLEEQPKIPKKKFVQKVQLKNAQEQKENGRGYIENVYDSDMAFQHMVKQNELAVMVDQCKQKATENMQSKKKNEKIDVFQPKKKTSHCKQKQEEEKKDDFQIRGFKDVAEIKYFGRPLPCKDCTLYLSQGQSSDLCPYHGRQGRDTPASRQVPKRFEKYL